MPIKIITHRGIDYPAFQAEGNAARWVMPTAMEICQPTGKEIGFDIGCNRLEWRPLAFSIPVDPAINSMAAFYPKCPTNLFDAYLLPGDEDGGDKFLVDYIFSSHCLEHLPNYVKALDYWWTRLKDRAVLFLYLPNMEYQQYWLPSSNRKHVHYLTPRILQSYFDDRQHMWGNVFITQGCDLNSSFTVIAEKNSNKHSEFTKQLSRVI